MENTLDSASRQTLTTRLVQPDAPKRVAVQSLVNSSPIAVAPAEPLTASDIPTIASRLTPSQQSPLILAREEQSRLLIEKQALHDIMIAYRGESLFDALTARMAIIYNRLADLEDLQEMRPAKGPMHRQGKLMLSKFILSSWSIETTTACTW